MDAFLQFLGRLHPLLIHFPIAFLIGAGALELLRWRRARPSEAGIVCLLLGSAGALAAALTGWLFAAHDPPGMGDVLERHRWTGVAVAAVASATSVLALRWRTSAGASAGLATTVRLGMLVSLALVAYSAHLGGKMIYGEGFVLDAFRGDGAGAERTADGAGSAKRELPASREEVPGELVPGDAGDPPIDRDASELSGDAPDDAPSAAAIEYLTGIRPIFQARCFECHGEKRKPKGNLKLTDMAAVLAREPDEAVIVPGDPDASPLYQRITLPADHEDVMPAKGEPLTAEEIGLIRRWIEEGARWEEFEEAEKSGALEPRGGSAPGEALETGQETRTVGEELAAPALVLAPEERAARDRACTALHAIGALAHPVSETSDEVEVNLAVTPERSGDAELALLAGLEPCLVSLDLSRCDLTDAGLAPVSRFTELRYLRLDHTPIGDAGLAHLATLTELESLNLFHTSVTDTGLPQLAPLARLRRLYLGETAVSDRGAAELSAMRAGLVVVHAALPPMR